MKKIFTLFFSIAIVMLFSGGVMAQDKPKTELTSVKQKSGTVHFNLTSSKPFIFGSNRYVLYVGTKEIFLHEQGQNNGKGYISFFMDRADFDKLIDGSWIYLTYGDVEVANTDMSELAKESPRCWSLGVFQKSLLK